MNPSPNTSPEERAENAASILRVPRDVLPDGPARRYLIHLAIDGQDVYAYKAAGPNGPWNLWLAGERVPVAEYVKGCAHNDQ